MTRISRQVRDMTRRKSATRCLLLSVRLTTKSDEVSSEVDGARAAWMTPKVPLKKKKLFYFIFGGKGRECVMHHRA